jgi:hypothetical protein
MNDLKTKLIMAVSAYDSSRSKRKGYNHYALGHYFRAVDDVIELVNSGYTPREAIYNVMNDRLREICLDAIKGPA